MAAHMTGKTSNNMDAKPAADRNMGANAKNPALCKIPKKEKE